MRAKLAVAAFVAITLLFGSVCSTTCALGACPIETQNAASHDCDHNASVPTHHNAPQNPDCPRHHHPTFDAVKTDALQQSQLSSANHVSATRLLVITTRSALTGVQSSALPSRFASPPNLNIPLPQQISVLRI
jgi:hypothetical protein